MEHISLDAHIFHFKQIVRVFKLFLTKGPPGEPSLKMVVDKTPLTLEKEDQTVLRAGQTVQLSCLSQGGYPEPKLLFFKNGQSFGLQGLNTFEFVATELDDGSSLSCSADNKAADLPLKSREIKLNVTYPPTEPTLQLLQDQKILTPNLRAGQRVQLKCSADANPKPTFIYKQNGKTIGSGDQIDFFVNNMDDGSSLSCSAENSVTEIPLLSSTINLNVKYPPNEPTLILIVDNQILEVQNDLVILQNGQNVQIKCSGDGGNPEPLLTIYENGQSLGTYFWELEATELDNGSILSCSAENSATNMPIYSRKIRLNVQYPPSKVSIKLKIDDQEQDSQDMMTVQSSQSVQIECSADGGNPVPAIYIKKCQNGSPVCEGSAPKFGSNIHEFVATPKDNGAKLSCSADMLADDRRVDSRVVKLKVLSEYLSSMQGNKVFRVLK